jgi:hypothetical protein
MTYRLYKVVLASAAVLAGLAQLAKTYNRPAADVPAPLVTNVREAAGRVDAVFDSAWREANVEPVGPAEPMTVVRRLSLALCGTIPSLEEIRSLEKLSPEEQIDSHLDRLLADRRFADYFAERFARAIVGTENGPFIIYRRSRFIYWLSDELMRNTAYDELVRQIISAEGLWTDRPATNFITAEASDQGLDPIRLAARTSRAFLGIRIDCAQCHDHPFTDWKQRDFEGLAAYYGQTKNSFRGIVDRAGELEVEDIKTKEKREVSPQPPFAPESCPNGGRRREQLAAWITSEKTRTDPDGNPHDDFAEAIVNRVWTLLFGQGIVEPVDDLEADRRVPGLLEELAHDFRSNGCDLKRLVRVIAATRAFRMNAADSDGDATEAEEKTFAAFPMTRLRSEQIAGSMIQASSLQTVDADSHIVVRTTRFFSTLDFVKHYGDAGEEELNAHIGTIPQRLVMMNGKMPRERLKASPFNAAGRISGLSSSDESRVRAAYLVALTRSPSREEVDHFVERIGELKQKDKHEGVEDLMWALFNSTEFSWNH